MFKLARTCKLRLRPLKKQNNNKRHKQKNHTKKTQNVQTCLQRQMFVLACKGIQLVTEKYFPITSSANISVKCNLIWELHQVSWNRLHSGAFIRFSFIWETSDYTSIWRCYRDAMKRVLVTLVRCWRRKMAETNTQRN